MKVLEELAGAGKVYPGMIKVGWDRVDGAISYQVKIAKHRSPQSDTAGDIETGISGDEGFVRGLLPNKTYWMSVRPVGPKGFDGQPSLGLRCTTIQFATAAMRAPTIDPQSAFPTSYLAIPTIEWHAKDGSVRYSVRFYARTQNGSCSATPAAPETIVDDSGTGDFQGFGGGKLVVDMFSPPNASGYCWDVAGIAADGSRSPRSEQRRIVYSDKPVPIGPGNKDFTVNIGGTLYRQYPPGPLPVVMGTSSYGSSVTLDLNAVAPPHPVWKYRLRGGRYPWYGEANLLPIPEPTNCLGFSACEYSPKEPFTAEVAGDELTTTIMGDTASKGRTCWAVWPVLAGSRQPLPGVDVAPAAALGHSVLLHAFGGGSRLRYTHDLCAWHLHRQNQIPLRTRRARRRRADAERRRGTAALRSRLAFARRPARNSQTSTIASSRSMSTSPTPAAPRSTCR